MPADSAISTQIFVTVGTTTSCLTDGSITWRISDDDLAMAPIRRLSEQGPLQHGDTDLGFRLDPRLFTLTLETLVNASLSALYNNRKQVINIFKPLSSTPILVKYILPNGDTRQIDCFTNGKIMINEDTRQGFSERCIIPLKASDPTFYDPTQVTTSLLFNTLGGVPLTIPWSLNSGASYSGNINYLGNWPVGPVITLTGPLVNPVIQNLSTRETLSFTVTLAAGQTFTIDCRYGNTTVKDQAGVNQISTLSSTSNLATFHLGVDPDVTGGVNQFQVNGGGITVQTAVLISYYNRYIGI